MLPPRFLRRLVFGPLVILFTMGAIVVSPLLFLIGLIATPSRWRRRRTLRLIWFGLSWLVMESLALMACLGLWIASGFGGRMRSAASMDRHYALVRWFLSTLFNRAVAVFQLRVEVDEPPATPEEQAARLTRPVIVLSRHAGPGDSFLLVHQLLSTYQRRPRIVMKAALQFDPSIDVVINRLPHAFVHPHRTVPTPRDPSESSSGPAESSRGPLAEPSAGPSPERSPGLSPERSPGPAPERSPGPAPEHSPGPAPEHSPGPAPERSPGPAPEPESGGDGLVIQEIRR